MGIDQFRGSRFPENVVVKVAVILVHFELSLAFHVLAFAVLVRSRSAFGFLVGVTGRIGVSRRRCGLALSERND